MRILLIYTGGTIGMVSDPATGALKPLDFNEIESEIPALRRLGVEISHHSGFAPIDSSDMTPGDWGRLARAIGDNYDRYDGFVVLHGTDTMAYTASALSFMLRGLTKPVVFTGSQIPIGVLRTDGRENLVTAVEIAASATPMPSQNATPTPTVPEVSIYFQNRLFRANRTTKWSAEQLNAFTSENYPPLAEVGVSIHYNHAAITGPASSPVAPLEISTSMSTDVALVRLFPGMTERVLEAALGVPGLRGVVLQTYGAGNTPTSEWFLGALADVIDRGIVIVNVTQCIAGGVRPIYESAHRLRDAGVISGGDMTPEAAITKLMYVLGLGLGADRSAAMLASDLRGEITEISEITT